MKEYNMINHFDNAIEFVELDNRRFRPANPITSEQLYKRHKAIFNEDFVKGKSVLDLGCCLGATGHWCLSLGAKSYLGLETQKEYVEEGDKLIKKYHGDKGKVIQDSIENFLKNNSEKYDIVCMFGVLYVFIDVYGILEKVSKIANENVIIDTLYPDMNKYPVDACIIDYIDNQHINLSNNFQSLVGRGSRTSPNALKFIMQEFGFGMAKDVSPERIQGSYDVYDLNNRVYDPMGIRYIVTFERTGKAKDTSISNDLNSDKVGVKIDWNN